MLIVNSVLTSFLISLTFTFSSLTFLINPSDVFKAKPTLHVNVKAGKVGTVPHSIPYELHY